MVTAKVKVTRTKSRQCKEWGTRVNILENRCSTQSDTEVWEKCEGAVYFMLP